MANQNHLDTLKQGLKHFARWRLEHPNIMPDFSGADLRGFELGNANFIGAKLKNARLSKANLFGAFLMQADLRDADLSYANLTSAKLEKSNLSGATLSYANLSGADFRKTNLYEAILMGAILNETNLSRANLTGAGLVAAQSDGAKLIEANLSQSKLVGAFLVNADMRSSKLIEADCSIADLRSSNLQNAKLYGANLIKANLNEADLSGADLSGAILSGANLNGADLRGAKLYETDISEASLVQTKLKEANLTNSRVYGISAWDLLLDNTKQTGLIITKPGDPVVTVDDIEVAQFIYFMLNNKQIRRVINALTSKAVLILGRFTEKRKEILDALRDKLSRMDYLPIIFDFKKPTDRNFTETVLTLACLSKFVIIDLTDPSSTPHESKTMIPDLKIPFLPIIQEGHSEYAMFRDFEEYPWVLKGKTYKNKDDLIEKIEKLTEAAEAKYSEIRSQKDNYSSNFTPL